MSVQRQRMLRFWGILQYKNFDLIEMKYGRFINDFDVQKDEIRYS